MSNNYDLKTIHDLGILLKTGLRVCLKVNSHFLNTYENNPPPDVGFQPYTGDDNKRT